MALVAGPRWCPQHRHDDVKGLDDDPEKHAGEIER